MEIKTRIAPSPTGFFHLGTARTALFNYAFAKKNEGKFVLRIEDTDKERSEQKYEDDIKENLLWLGLIPDETYRQSDQLPEHTKALEKLVEKNAAYISKEPAKDDPEREVEVVRLKNPNETITFHDVVRGDISFDTTELGDFVIARSMSEPLYHLAVVVDDATSSITHVLRGEDHISNTPRQLLIARALDYSEPVYAHLPLILAKDRSKLSKRKHAVAIKDFRERGFLPEALINYLALLGWTPPQEETFSLDGFIEHFDLTHVHKGGAVFDEEKLRSINREHLLQLEKNTFHAKIQEEIRTQVPDLSSTQAGRLAPIVGERMHVLKDVADMAKAGEFAYYIEQPDIDADLLVWKDSTAEETKEILQELEEKLGALSEASFDSAETAREALWDYASERGRGSVLWPLRYALTGREKSPDPFSVCSILGKDEVLERIRSAKKKL